MSPCCWLLFQSGSERPRLSGSTSGHTNGSQRQSIALSGRTCGDRRRAPLAPQGVQLISSLWSWPFAYAEKGTGAEARGWRSAKAWL